jgi:hypothetical protein
LPRRTSGGAGGRECPKGTMSTVTYKNQPAIERTRGKVPLAGTSHLYRVKRILWPRSVESVLRGLLVPTSLHVCSGHSLLGDIRVDSDRAVSPHIVGDAARLPFADQSINSVLCDPPYNGRFQWNHDMLSELSRVARRRIIFQHRFMPADRLGRWKKFHKFRVTVVYAWQPKTYFGRAQIITVFDALDEDRSEMCCDLLKRSSATRQHSAAKFDEVRRSPQQPKNASS